MSFDDHPTHGHQTAKAGDEAAADGATGDPASHDPDTIRAEIERTRSDVSRDVNALGEAVSPGSITKRLITKAGTKLKEGPLASQGARHGLRAGPAGEHPQRR